MRNEEAGDKGEGEEQEEEKKGQEGDLDDFGLVSNVLKE